MLRLGEELRGFDDDARRDMLLEIEDHLDELARQHPEKTEEEVVAELEKPEVLGACLRDESGFAEAGSGSSGERHDESRARQGPRIIIDGHDLEDIVRRALDTARMFSRATPRKTGTESSGSVINLGENVKRLSLRSESANINLYLSLSGTRLESEADTRFTIKADDDGSFRVETAKSSGEPDEIQIWAPSSVEEISITTTSGDVRVFDRIGCCNLRTVSGDIRVDACDGDLRSDSASGDIEVRGCTGSINAGSASGDVSVRLDERSDSVRASSISGELEIGYPEGLDASFTWSTKSGDVECDAPRQRANSARTGDGLVPVQLNTVSGSIKIEKL